MGIEKFSTTEKVDDDGLSAEEREMAEYFLSLASEAEVPKIERRDCTPEIVELQHLFTSFESKHSLETLYAIVDLSTEEAPKNLIREAAHGDLEPINAKLNILRKETDISSEKFNEIESQYQRLSNAVGIINGGKVRHE